jgi:hypothetical protein
MRAYENNYLRNLMFVTIFVFIVVATKKIELNIHFDKKTSL